MDPSYYERINSAIGRLEDNTPNLKFYQEQCRAMVEEFVRVRDSLTIGPNGESATTELNFKELFRLTCEAERVLANCCCEQWLQAAVLQSDRTVLQTDRTVLQSDRTIFEIIWGDLESCLGTLFRTGNLREFNQEMQEDESTVTPSNFVLDQRCLSRQLDELTVQSDLDQRCLRELDELTVQFDLWLREQLDDLTVQFDLDQRWLREQLVELTVQFDLYQRCLRKQLDEMRKQDLLVGLLRARLENNEVEHVFAGLADGDRQDGCVLGGNDRSLVKEITLLGIELAEKSFHIQIADECRKEVEVMAKLNHPNVVRFIGCTLEGGAGRNQPAIIMERGEMCLETYLQNRRRQEIGERTIGNRWSSQGPVDNRAGPLLPPSVAVDIMVQVALGMAYLHDQNIVHLDLKPANLVLTSCTEHEFPRVKIADFGLSRKVVIKIDEGKITVDREGLGTTVYKAPEVFKVKSKICPKKADVYCFGMTCWQILHCQDPTLTTMAPITCLDHVLRCRGPQIVRVAMRNMGEEVAKGRRLNIHRNIPSHLRHLIEVCWRTNPDDRPSFSDICLFLQSYKASLLGSSLSVLDVFPSVQQKRSMFGEIREATKSLVLRILPSPQNFSSYSSEDEDEFKFPGDEAPNVSTSREDE
jgi:serine/threonine protein kinase